MTNIMVSNNNEMGFTIRTLRNNKNIYYCAVDIGKALNVKNPSYMAKKYINNDDDKIIAKMKNGSVIFINKNGVINIFENIYKGFDSNLSNEEITQVLNFIKTLPLSNATALYPCKISKSVSSKNTKKENLNGTYKDCKVIQYNQKPVEFTHEQFGVLRTITIDGEPYFVGKDVAEILGYANPQKAVRDHVDDDDKGVNEMDTPGGVQPVMFINESGLYSLILSSKLPAAKRFKRWITSEVLPAIRKHGLYATEELIANPDLAIAAFQALKEEREKRKALESENELQKKQIIEMKPIINGFNKIIAGSKTMTVSNFGKLVSSEGYNMGPMKMMDFLRYNNILNIYNKPYQQFINNGCCEWKERYIANIDKTSITPYLTSKGQKHVLKLLDTKYDEWMKHWQEQRNSQVM